MIENFLPYEGFVLYLLIFLALMGGAIGLPIPEDVPLIAAGILIQLEQAKPELIVPICYFGILLGDLMIFFIGRKLGPTLFSKKWFRKRLPPHRLRKFRIGLEKRSLATIFLARHLFYLRTVTFLTCGAVKMKLSRFLIADAIAALISVPIMVSIGYYAAGHYEQVKRNFHQATLFILLALVIFIVVYFYRKRAAKIAKPPTENDQED